VVLLPATAALADPSLATIEAQIDQKNNEVEKVVEAFNLVNDQLAATQAQLDALKVKMAPLQSSVDKAQGNVDQIAYTAYKGNSALGAMSVLLEAGSSSNTLMDQLTTLDQLSKNQQRDIATYTNAKKGFDAEKSRLDALLAAQNAQKTDLATKKAKIEGDLKALQALEAKALANGGKGPDNSKGTVTKIPAVSGAAGVAVRYAFSKLGDKYVYGTAGPSTFDCSGLTMAAWKAAGKSLPHNAASQYHSMAHISKSALAPGDLVFYNGLGHVAIYVGSGMVIHAPNSRTVVKEVTIAQAGSVYGYGRP
jgi:cell wall-associated NlpC family hydrolase